MKHIVKCIAAVAFATLLASCEKALEELAPNFPSVTDETVSITSGETVSIDFTLNDVRGNAITVTYEENAPEEYKIGYTLNEGNNSGVITIAAPQLILDGTQFEVTFTFSDAANSRTASKTITVKPTVVAGYVKISEGANCFVVAPGAYVAFPTLKGNSGEAAVADFVGLAWQDTKGLFDKVIEDGEDYSLIHFNDGKEGNALVNGYDKEGNVVWSWLFWVISDTPKDVTVGEYTFLDRNIGALNLDEKSELSVGVVYQYGRKDPFPGIKFGEYDTRAVYDANGEKVEITIVNTTEANNLANAIKNPTIFYNNKYYSGCKHGYSWITTDATTFGADNFKALWENDGKKSTYDPCPAGYKVASSAEWSGAVSAASTKTELWDDSYETFDSSAIGTNEKYIPGNKKKVQFRGCTFDGLRLTITGELNSNSTEFSVANCIGKPLPTAEVWCSDIDSGYTTNPIATYFRGCAFKVNTTGNGNYEDISAIKVNSPFVGKYTLNYALPVRCVKE